MSCYTEYQRCNETGKKEGIKVDGAGARPLGGLRLKDDPCFRQPQAFSTALSPLLIQSPMQVRLSLGSSSKLNL